jgi:hypothetical protein
MTTFSKLVGLCRGLFRPNSFPNMAFFRGSKGFIQNTVFLEFAAIRHWYISSLLFTTTDWHCGYGIVMLLGSHLNNIIKIIGIGL